MTKKLFLTLTAALILLSPAIALAGDKRIGDLCNSNSDCRSGNCEDSNLDDDHDDFCVCSDANQCPATYSQLPSQNWECVDGTGNKAAHALHYCKGSISGPQFPVSRPGDSNQGPIDAIIDADAFLKATGNEIDTILKTPQPRIRIPGLTFTAKDQLPVVQDESGQIFLYIPFVGEYISAIYRYSIMVFGIVAVVMIIVAGFQWAVSGGNQEMIQSAQKRIVNSIIGIIIAVTSYSILYLINPELVRFRSLRVEYVLKEELPGDIEGEPDTLASEASANIHVSAAEATLPANCNLAKLSEYQTNQTKFGKENGYCLGWVKSAMNAACGEIPKIMTGKNGAWDVAAAMKSINKFHPCDLKDIKDGDLVFMASVGPKGSNFISLWSNFRMGTNGCTIADGLPSGQAKRYKDGAMIQQPPVFGEPKGMPPVTHIGIYRQGKVYHLVDRVADGDASAIKRIENVGPKSGKINWQGITLTGNFLQGTSEFIAGYGSLTP